MKTNTITNLINDVTRFDEYNQWLTQYGQPTVGYKTWRKEGSPGAGNPPATASQGATESVLYQQELAELAEATATGYDPFAD